ELLSEGDRRQLPEMSHSSLFPSQRRYAPDIAGNSFGRRYTPSLCGNDKPPPGYILEPAPFSSVFVDIVQR
ncbi:MAG: hypothetical protein M3Y35_10945, partial [Actinomycetota bacterium]|nr:hypothetical protein [Actinomycetota bacterium]